MRSKPKGILGDNEKRYLNALIIGMKQSGHGSCRSRLSEKYKKVPLYTEDLRLLIHGKNFDDPRKLDTELLDMTLKLSGIESQSLLMHFLINAPSKLVDIRGDNIVPSKSFTQTMRELYPDLTSEEIVFVEFNLLTDIKSLVQFSRVYKAMSQRDNGGLRKAFFKFCEDCKKTDSKCVFLKRYTMEEKKFSDKLSQLGLIRKVRYKDRAAIIIMPMGTRVYDTLVKFHKKAGRGYKR